MSDWHTGADKLATAAKATATKRKTAAANMEVANYIRRTRISLGITQSQLAEMTGNQQATVSRWEAGIFPIGEDALRRIRGAFLYVENGGETPDVGEREKRRTESALEALQIAVGRLEREASLQAEARKVFSIRIARLEGKEMDADGDIVDEYSLPEAGSSETSP